MGQPAFPNEALVLLKHDPITNYPWWARWLLRLVYRLTNYDGGIQLQAICTTEQRAEELALHAGYRAIWLPVNESLPEEQCQWKPAIHFKSPYREDYQHYWPKMVAVPRSRLNGELHEIHRRSERLGNILSS